MIRRPPRSTLGRSSAASDGDKRQELNEAFAVIDVMFSRAFPGHEDGYNVFGGALAYGHPYGASGAIILLHLLKSLQKRGGRFGAASVAAAGGVGTALLIERC